MIHERYNFFDVYDDGHIYHHNNVNMYVFYIFLQFFHICVTLEALRGSIFLREEKLFSYGSLEITSNYGQYEEAIPCFRRSLDQGLDFCLSGVEASKNRLFFCESESGI